MAESNAASASHASPNIDAIVELMRPQLEAMQQKLDQFHAQPITPAAFFALEEELRADLRELLNSFDFGPKKSCDAT